MKGKTWLAKSSRAMSRGERPVFVTRVATLHIALLSFITPEVKRTYVLLLLTLLALPSSAQVTARLIGTVTDSTGAVLRDINVFIASSMQGTTTDAVGRYELGAVPLGTLRLYVSAIGYESQYQDIFVRNAQTYTINFQLVQTTYQLGELTVTADNRRWRRQFERFRRLFIGETAYAGETTITNAEVLDFSGRGRVFRAQAREPLVIENNALGYRLTYYLREFIAEPTSWRWDGEPLFEPLKPDSPEQAAQWNARRDSAFFGSFRHFLLAVINDQATSEGFELFSRPAAGPQQNASSQGGGLLRGKGRFPVAASEILKPGATSRERILDFQGFIEIVYTRELEDQAFLDTTQPERRRARFQTSVIKLDRGPTIIDTKGDPLDPYGVTFYGGYFAYERIANMLPKEYRPWND